jgi:hypothetical protein
MKPRVGAEIDCFDQALHFVDAEALGVRQAFQRLRVGGLEKPIVAPGSNDLATHVNRRPHAVSAEKTKEVCIPRCPSSKVTTRGRTGRSPHFSLPSASSKSARAITLYRSAKKRR